jgi:hypothetical protein
MTAAVVLLQRLRAAEVDVVADADRLRLRSRTPLPPDLIELARKHKPDLLALLAGDDPPSAWGLTAAEREGGTARLRARSDPAVQLDGYHRVAFQRPPSWWRREQHQPPNGAWCSCCHLRRWWTRDRLGWCCFTCHPPPRAASTHFEEVRT